MRKVFIFLAVVLCAAVAIIMSRTLKDDSSGRLKSGQEINEAQETPSPALRPKKYFLYVANCFHESCKDMYMDLLRREREPVVHESTPVTNDVYRLVSQEIHGFQRMNKVIDKISDAYKSLDISFVRKEETYKLYIGNFSGLSEAKAFKVRLERLFPGKSATLNMEKYRTTRAVSKIMAGPYATRDEANMVLKRLRNNKKFQGAFLIYF